MSQLTEGMEQWKKEIEQWSVRGIEFVQQIPPPQLYAACAVLLFTTFLFLLCEFLLLSIFSFALRPFGVSLI